MKCSLSIQLFNGFGTNKFNFVYVFMSFSYTFQSHLFLNLFGLSSKTTSRPVCYLWCGSYLSDDVSLYNTCSLYHGFRYIMVSQFIPSATEIKTYSSYASDRTQYLFLLKMYCYITNAVAIILYTLLKLIFICCMLEYNS